MRVTSLANGTADMRVPNEQYQLQHDLTAFRGIMLAGGASALLWLTLLVILWACGVWPFH